MIRPINSGISVTPDVYVGRVPVYDNTAAAKAETRDYFEKMKWFMQYQNSGLFSAWRDNALLLGTVLHFFDERTALARCTATDCTGRDKADGSTVSEDIVNSVLEPKGYTTRRVYDAGHPDYEPEGYFDYGNCPAAPYDKTYCEEQDAVPTPQLMGTLADPLVTHSNLFHSVLMLWFAHGEGVRTKRMLWNETDGDHRPEGVDCGSELDKATHSLTTRDGILATTSRNRRFVAFLGSCKNNLWCHNKDLANRNVAEALLARQAVAVAASTESLYMTSDFYLDYENQWVVQALGYRFAQFMTKTTPYRYFVGQAFFHAASLGDPDAPDINETRQWANIMHLNLLGDPRLRLKNNL